MSGVRCPRGWRREAAVFCASRNNPVVSLATPAAGCNSEHQTLLARRRGRSQLDCANRLPNKLVQVYSLFARRRVVSTASFKGDRDMRLTVHAAVLSVSAAAGQAGSVEWARRRGGGAVVNDLAFVGVRGAGHIEMGAGLLLTHRVLSPDACRAGGRGLRRQRPRQAGSMQFEESMDQKRRSVTQGLFSYNKKEISSWMKTLKSLDGPEMPFDEMCDMIDKGDAMLRVTKESREKKMRRFKHFDLRVWRLEQGKGCVRCMHRSVVVSSRVSLRFLPRLVTSHDTMEQPAAACFRVHRREDRNRQTKLQTGGMGHDRLAACVCSKMAGDFCGRVSMVPVGAATLDSTA